MPTDVFQSIRLKEPGIEATLDSLDDINIRDEDGQNLLHEAVSAGNAIAAKQLVARGIDVNAQDKNGQTALHYAAARRATELVIDILSHGGDCSLADVHGNTPLWTAVFNARGQFETIRALVGHGCLAVANQKNNHGRSPIDFARQIGDKELLRIIDPQSSEHV